MGKAGKFGPEARLDRAEDGPEGFLETAEASEKAPQAPVEARAPCPAPAGRRPPPGGCRPSGAAAGSSPDGPANLGTTSPRRRRSPPGPRKASASGCRPGRKPPCPARPASERPPRGAGRDRQGLRPVGASRQHPARLHGRLATIRVLAAPPGARGDAARPGSGRPVPRVSSRARRRGTLRLDPRAAPVRHRLALRQLGQPLESATAISPPCSPASAGGTAALPCRKRRSSPTNSWRCWRRWRWT